MTAPTANPAGTRLLTLEIDGEEWEGAVTGVRIQSAASDSDITTFYDAANGGSRQYTLAFTVVNDYQADTLWDKAFSNAGDTVAFKIRPYGNAASVSSTKPGFSGNCVIAEPDGDFIGGDANVSTTARQTSDFAWICTAKPTRIVSDSSSS
jgi:hypothetical protein